MDIEIIKREFPNSISDQKCALFDRWLRIYPSASWDDVVLALEAIGENHLAQTIQTNKKQWVILILHVLSTNLFHSSYISNLVRQHLLFMVNPLYVIWMIN